MAQSDFIDKREREREREMQYAIWATSGDQLSPPRSYLNNFSPQFKVNPVLETQFHYFFSFLVSIKDCKASPGHTNNFISSMVKRDAFSEQN